MKKPILIMLIFTFSLMLTGCNFIEEKKAEGIIKNYYQAIIDGDYEKAFEQLLLYDYDSKTEAIEDHYGTTFAIGTFCERVIEIKKLEHPGSWMFEAKLVVSLQEVVEEIEQINKSQ